MKDEVKLVVLLKEGDAHAFTQLYNVYFLKIYSFCLNIVKSADLAQDITHDVFVKIWEGSAKLDSDKSFQSYLFTIAHHQVLNLIKRSKLETALINEMLKCAEQTINYTDQALDYNESARIVLQAVNSLPPKRKLIFELCKNEGLTYKQVAEQLGISPDTVNSQMVKAIKSIRDFLVLNGAASLLLTIFYPIK